MIGQRPEARLQERKIPTFTRKRSQNDPKVIPKWSEHYPKILPKQSENYSRTLLKWSESDSEFDSFRHFIGRNTCLRIQPQHLSKNNPKTIPKRSQNDPSIIPTYSQNNPKIIRECFWRSQTELQLSRRGAHRRAKDAKREPKWIPAGAIFEYFFVISPLFRIRFVWSSICLRIQPKYQHLAKEKPRKV